MIKNKMSRRKQQKSPVRDLNNVSNMRLYYGREDSDDVFSNSDIPSFNSENSKKLKQKKKKYRDNFGNQTIVTQPFTKEKSYKVHTPSEENSIKTNSKYNLKVSQHIKLSTLNSKLTLDGISNKTHSCLTMKTKSRFMGSDSHFPSTYNDINNLTDEQIQEIIRHKMKLLDKYNEKILKKKNSLEYK